MGAAATASAVVLRQSVRRVFKRIHPDYFYQDQQAKQVNREAVQRLRAIVGPLVDRRLGPPPTALALAKQWVPWLGAPATRERGDHLLRCFVHEKMPQERRTREVVFSFPQLTRVCHDMLRAAASRSLDAGCDYKYATCVFSWCDEEQRAYLTTLAAVDALQLAGQVGEPVDATLAEELDGYLTSWQARVNAELVRRGLRATAPAERSIREQFEHHLRETLQRQVRQRMDADDAQPASSMEPQTHRGDGYRHSAMGVEVDWRRVYVARGTTVQQAQSFFARLVECAPSVGYASWAWVPILVAHHFARSPAGFVVVPCDFDAEALWAYLREHLPSIRRERLHLNEAANDAASNGSI